MWIFFCKVFMTFAYKNKSKLLRLFSICYILLPRLHGLFFINKVNGIHSLLIMGFRVINMSVVLPWHFYYLCWDYSCSGFSWAQNDARYPNNKKKHHEVWYFCWILRILFSTYSHFRTRLFHFIHLKKQPPIVLNFLA